MILIALCCPAFVTGISIQLTDVESGLDLQQRQINNITEEVNFLDAEVSSLGQNDVIQDDRLDSVEDNMKELDDKITALEVANIDITDRLIILEEIILGERVT